MHYYLHPNNYGVVIEFEFVEDEFDTLCELAHNRDMLVGDFIRDVIVKFLEEVSR